MIFATNNTIDDLQDINSLPHTGRRNTADDYDSEGVIRYMDDNDDKVQKSINETLELMGLHFK